MAKRTHVVDGGGTSRLVKRMVIVDGAGISRVLKRAFIVDSGGAARQIFIAATAYLPPGGLLGDGYDPALVQAHGSVSIDASGTYVATGSPTNFITTSGSWYEGNGTISDFEVKLDITSTTGSGSATGQPTGTWLQTSSTRTWAFSTAGIYDISGTVSIRYLGSTDVLASTSFNITLNAT